MDWKAQIYELIDFRSFANLWYWLVLAAVWSSASHWTLGIPYDIIQRARRQRGQFEADLAHLVQVNVNRIDFYMRAGAHPLVAMVTFSLTVLGLLGFVYWIEFCQAVFLLLLPLSLVGWLSVNTARRITETHAEGEALHKLLRRHRLYVQLIGMVAIFVTAFWGMLQNFELGAIPG